MKLRIRSKALLELNDLFSTAIAVWSNRVAPNDLFQSCNNCLYMNKSGPALCHRYHCVPPVKVIVGEVHCEGWTPDEDIPIP